MKQAPIWRASFFAVSEALENIQAREGKSGGQTSGVVLYGCFIPRELVWESIAEEEFRRA